MYNYNYVINQVFLYGLIQSQLQVVARQVVLEPPGERKPLNRVLFDARQNNVPAEALKARHCG